MSKSKRVFLVDDNIVNLNIGKRILQTEYSVVSVASGKKLLEMLEKFQADLILLDVEMPEMSGYEVIQKLKANRETAVIPVIFLTGKDDSEDKQRGLSLGAVDYINKPFTPALLLERIERLFLHEGQEMEPLSFTEGLEELAAGCAGEKNNG